MDLAQEQSPSSTPPAWRTLGAAAAVLSAALLMFTPLVADPDLWGHVRFGQDLWQTGQIIRADPYSYLTGGQPWINHEWLTEALYALLFNRAGAGGLIALNLALSLAIVGLLYRELIRRGAGLVPAGIIVLLFALLLRPGVLNVRPQVLTYLLFLLVLLLITAVERGRLRCVWAIAPLSALWANLHGGVLAGVGIFLLWGLIHLASAVGRERRLGVLGTPPNLAILANMIACPLALLLNPFGVRLVTFLLRTATVPRPEIAEWKPIAIADLWGQLFFAGLLVTLLGVAFSRRRRQPALMGALLCTAVLPLLSARHTPLFAVAALALAGEHIADAARRCTIGRLSAALHRLETRPPRPAGRPGAPHCGPGAGRRSAPPPGWHPHPAGIRRLSRVRRGVPQGKPGQRAHDHGFQLGRVHHLAPWTGHQSVGGWPP